MIKLYNSRLLAFVCLIFSVAVFTACEKDDNTNSGRVELLSFGPTGAQPGDTLRFFGINLNRVNSIEFTGTNATVDKSEFKQQTSQLILLIVPIGTEKGYVTLKTPDGDIVTKTQLNLSISTTVTSITPEARPGENITITGDFLNWVTKVTFERDLEVTTFVSQSLNQLVVQVPETAQTGTVMLTYLGTDSSFVMTDSLFVTLPVATAFSPNPVKHADNITITGTNIDLTEQVIFNGVSTPVTSFVSQSATELVVIVPGATQSGKVTLVAASGVHSESEMDLNVVLPAITGMTPNPVDPESNLTITGTNLDLVDGISFIGIAEPVKTFNNWTSTQIVVKVPAGTLKGKITLSVLNSSLTVSSADVLDIKGGLPPLADLAFPIYTDALQNGFQDWSFTDARDFNNSEIVRQGTSSIKATYGGNTYQGITLNGSTAISTAGYTFLEFSVFGGSGTDGKKLNIIINEQWGIQPQITIKAGEWTTFSLPLSSLTALGTPPTLKQLVLQSAGWTGVIHIDHVGLR